MSFAQLVIEFLWHVESNKGSDDALHVGLFNECDVVSKETVDLQLVEGSLGPSFEPFTK